MSAVGVPLLESKLHVPRRRRGVIQRARLAKRLHRDALPAVVLVSAPAGFGKTTLLAEWLAAGDETTTPTAWLSLDRRDSDPAVFWSYVVAAVRKVAPDVGADALSTLQATPMALEAVVTSLLNDLGALADDVVLVLDEYDLVESLAVQESMLFLVEHLPEQLHLVVASRADPPWPLAGLRARGELLEVRVVTATTVRIRLAAGDLAGAEQWAVDARLGVDDEPGYLRDYEQLSFARLLLATGRHAEAIGLLQRILAAADPGHRDGNAIEAWALLALAHEVDGDMPHALVALEEALNRAAVEGFVRVFLDAGAPMKALLKAAIHPGRAADQAAAVLAAAASPASPAPQGLVDELSTRELDVLRLLRSELSGPEIAAELVVSINTVRTHTKSIFMKLGVNSRRAALRRADELGL